MILFTADEIILLHHKLILATGGMPGLRDRGLVESAVFSMYRRGESQLGLPFDWTAMLQMAQTSEFLCFPQMYFPKN